MFNSSTAFFCDWIEDHDYAIEKVHIFMFILQVANNRTHES